MPTPRRFSLDIFVGVDAKRRRAARRSGSLSDIATASAHRAVSQTTH